MSEDWRIKKNYRTKRNCVRRHVLLVSLLVRSQATFEIGCLTQTFPESAKVLQQYYLKKNDIDFVYLKWW